MRHLRGSRRVAAQQSCGIGHGDCVPRRVAGVELGRRDRFGVGTVAAQYDGVDAQGRGQGGDALPPVGGRVDEGVGVGDERPAGACGET